MLTRVELAALDHNTNVGRGQARVKKPTSVSAQEGDLQYHTAFSKQTKQWVAKPIFNAKSYALCQANDGGCSATKAKRRSSGNISTS